MSVTSIKMKFLEEFIVLQDEQLIRKLYATLQQEQREGAPPRNTVRLSDFAGIWDQQEATQMQQAIDECRTIDTDEW